MTISRLSFCLVVAMVACLTAPASARVLVAGLSTLGTLHTSSLFKSSDTPQFTDSGDNAATVRGVQFVPLANGSITACRFYKASTNTGSHVCTLWNSAGSQLASVTFSGETASGWQQQSFTSPIAVTAGVQYVIGVFMPVGRYSLNQPPFLSLNYCSDVDSSIYIPTTGATTNGNGNGLYVMTSTSTTMPTNTYQGQNYWIDVVYKYTAVPLACPSGIQRVHDFIAKFGVNTQIQQQANANSTIADFQYLGLTNDRDFIVVAGTLTALEAMAAAGIRMHLEEDGPDDGVTAAVPAATFLGWMQTINSTYPNTLVGLSGPNEIDVTLSNFIYGAQNSYPAAVQLQKDIYNGVKGGTYSALTNVPVSILPVASPGSGTVESNIGNLTAFCDLANMHDYYANDNNTALIGGAGTGPIYTILPGWQIPVHTMCNRVPFVTTETGYCTGGGSCGSFSNVNADVQAKMILSDYFDHAMVSNCIAVYPFAMLDGAGNANWGLFDSTNTAKEAATAIHNLTTILADGSANATTFTPGNVTYSLSGMPTNSNNIVVAFGNGQFGIILWNETPIWNSSTQQQITISSSSVTLTLPAGSSGSVYNPISGTSAISTFTSTSSVALSLNDAPLIVIFTP